MRFTYDEAVEVWTFAHRKGKTLKGQAEYVRYFCLTHGLVQAKHSYLKQYYNKYKGVQI